jgi:hypothetical protein
MMCLMGLFGKRCRIVQKIARKGGVSPDGCLPVCQADFGKCGKDSDGYENIISSADSEKSNIIYDK